MPLQFPAKSSKSLLAQGIQYQILFCFKRDSGKRVFKALRRDGRGELKQEVLLKIFSKRDQSLQKEFESLSQAYSPYCARLLGFESFGGAPALVLEYIRGASLFQLTEHFSLGKEEIDHILASIHKGLEDLSGQGICHGDLSLDNVLVDERGQVRLIDFGKANYEKETQGTPPFVAPELLKGARPGFLSDLYSLGVIEAILRTPYPLSALKDLAPENFEAKSPLLSLDPAHRRFPRGIKKLALGSAGLRPLSYKAKELASLMESRRRPTVKKLAGRRKAPALFAAKAAVLAFISLFVGMASSQPYLSSHGWLKIYTHEWLFARVESFESYAPLSLPLRAGWRSIQWKSEKSQGLRKIFIPKGKTLFLNDESFPR